MRNIIFSVVAVTLLLCSTQVRSEGNAVFLRDAFTDAPAAGYRWTNGWSISGQVAHQEDDHALGDASMTTFVLTAGRRAMVSEADNWRTFWDIDLGIGYAKIPGDALNSLELGTWLGAEAFVTPRLSVAARIGAVYSERELSAYMTRTELNIGRAQVELAYYW